MPDLCHKRQPGGIYRCDKKPGHSGDHFCLLITGSWVTWHNYLDSKSKPSDPRRAPLKRGKHPRAVSDRQKENLEIWNIIKRAMVRAQICTNGYTSCMKCGTQNPELIDLDHIDGREWSPENAQLLCRSCHSRKHGDVQFSGSAS